MSEIKDCIQNFATELSKLIKQDFYERMMSGVGQRELKARRRTRRSSLPPKLSSSPIELEILRVLKEPMGSTELAKRLRKPAPSVRRSLAKMVRQGMVSRSGNWGNIHYAVK